MDSQMIALKDRWRNGADFTRSFRTRRIRIFQRFPSRGQGLFARRRVSSFASPFPGYVSFQSGRIGGRFSFCRETDRRTRLISASPPDVRWRLCPRRLWFSIWDCALSFGR